MGRAATLAENWDWEKLSAVARRETHRILVNRQDAEDAAQDAIIRAYRARARCVTPQAPHGWVRTIARNEAIRMLGSRRPAEEPMTGVLSGPLEPGVEDRTEVVLDRLAARDVLVRVPVADRSLLLRRYVLEQSSRQIASELAMPPATVRVRLHRAVKRLLEHEADWRE